MSIDTILFVVVTALAVIFAYKQYRIMNKEMKIRNKIQMITLITQQNEKYYIPLSNLFLDFNVICVKVNVAILSYNDFLNKHSDVVEDEFKTVFENYRHEISGLSNWLRDLKNVIFTHRLMDVAYIKKFGNKNSNEISIDFFAGQLENELKPIFEQLTKFGENNSLYPIENVDWTKCDNVVKEAIDAIKNNINANTLNAAKLYAELEKLYGLPKK